MKNLRKRSISLFLAVLMVFLQLPATAFAEPIESEQDSEQKIDASPVQEDNLPEEQLIVEARESSSLLESDGGIIDSSHFPDANFRAALNELYPDGLTLAQAADVTDLDVDDCGIYSLNGISYFPNLQELRCWGNSLTSLDVSGCPALELLVCSDNSLTSLDVSCCPELKNLGCDGNSLTSLDASNCSALEHLNCAGNSLTSLDVSGCSALGDLYCEYNSLTNLDISDCSTLGEFTCNNNSLTSLDLSGCPGLGILLCGDNSLTSLDLSSCPALGNLRCGNNSLTSLDVSVCPELWYLECGGNSLASLDISGCPMLEYLDCGGNSLASLDISGCPVLKSLYCFGNPSLTSLVLCNCPELEYLSCGGNRLTSLDVSGCPKLQHLYCYNNSLTSLDVSGCPVLETLECYENSLASLDLSSCPNLQKLYCDCNFLTSLDLSGCPNLELLNCWSNSLPSLDLSGCPNLQKLYCGRNSVPSLDLSGCPMLEYLDCGCNSLTSLDVSGCPNLQYLYCGSNSLPSLDVSGCSALGELYCENNSLTSLDLSNNSAITTLYCSSQTIANAIALPADGEYYVDMAKVVGTANLSRVSADQYDQETGLLKVDKVDGSDTVAGSYLYDTGFDGESMKVNLVDIIYDPSTVITASGTCGENVSWVLTADGTLTISGTGDMTDFTYEYYMGADFETLPSVPWKDVADTIVSAIIEDGVTSIGMGAFYGCSNLESVRIPEGVVSINQGAFDGTGLKSVDIPAGVKTIGIEAFSCCSALTSVTLREGLVTIDYGAFSFCSGLPEIVLPASLTEIGINVFFSCTSLASISVASDSTIFSSADGVLYSKDGTRLELFPSGRTGSFAVPYGVTAVDSLAFNSNSLTELTFSPTVKTFNEDPNSTSDYNGWEYLYLGNLERLVICSTWFTSDRVYVSSNLKEIYFVGNESEWEGLGWTFGTEQELVVIYNYDSCGDSHVWMETGYDWYPHAAVEEEEYNVLQGCLAYRCCRNNEKHVEWASAIITEEITQPSTTEQKGVKTYTAHFDEDWAEDTQITESIPKLDDYSGQYGDLAWSLSKDGTLTISGSGKMNECAGWREYSWSTYRDIIQKVILTDGLESVGSYAFNAYYITEISFPDTLTEIGAQVFDGCEALTDVYYEGTQAQWEQVTNHASLPEGVTIHYYDPCTEGHDWDEGVVTKEPTETEEGERTYTCQREGCGATKTETIPVVTSPAITIGSGKAKPGDTIDIILSLSDAPAVKAISIRDLTYDTEVLTLIGGEWLIEGEIGSVNISRGLAVITMKQNTDVNGDIMKLTFQINEDAEDGVYPISCGGSVKQKLSDTETVDISMQFVSGQVTAQSVLPGDMDGNGVLTDDDAIYLLYHYMMPEDFPANQDADFDGNGVLTDDDAIYLLYHYMMPEDFPLMNQ